jgi:hypothetical protein
LHGEELGRAAGLENFYRQRGRHTFANRLIEDGMDAYLAMQVARRRLIWSRYSDWLSEWQNLMVILETRSLRNSREKLKALSSDWGQCVIIAKVNKHLIEPIGELPLKQKGYRKTVLNNLGNCST